MVGEKTGQSTEDANRIRSLRQLKVLRTMLRINSFTRKQLAEASSETDTYMNQLVETFKARGFLQSTGVVRSGHQGPPEEKLELTESGRDAFLRETSASNSMGHDPRDPSLPLQAVPAAMQYDVARELIDDCEKTAKLSVARLKRLIGLLRSVSQSEELPVENLVGESLRHDRQDWTDRKLVVSARLDFLRGKLCWLALDAPERNTEQWEDQQYFDFRPDLGLGELGLAHLQLATRGFLRYAEKDLAGSVDYWSINHLRSVLLQALILGPQNAMKVFLERIDPGLLPRVHQCVSRIATPKLTDIEDGLVEYCNQHLKGKAAALLDIREESISLAIVGANGNVILRKSQCLSAAPEAEQLVDLVRAGLASHQNASPDKAALFNLYVAGPRAHRHRFFVNTPERLGSQVQVVRLDQQGISRAAEVGLCSLL